LQHNLLGPDRKNVVYKQGLFFKKRLNWSEMSDREITCNQVFLELPDNHISTRKYTLLSFIPKNLFLQFSKLANLYFLVLLLFESITLTLFLQNIKKLYSL